MPSYIGINFNFMNLYPGLMLHTLQVFTCQVFAARNYCFVNGFFILKRLFYHVIKRLIIIIDIELLLPNILMLVYQLISSLPGLISGLGCHYKLIMGVRCGYKHFAHFLLVCLSQLTGGGEGREIGNRGS